MPRGDKSAYSDQQKRKAEHIEESYEAKGVGEKEAAARAWATVNKQTGGGEKSGSGKKVSPKAKSAARKDSARRGTAAKRGRSPNKGSVTGRKKSSSGGRRRTPRRPRRSAAAASRHSSFVSLPFSDRYDRDRAAARSGRGSAA
jgi:plasmid stabilization system protein ParE